MQATCIYLCARLAAVEFVLIEWCIGIAKFWIDWPMMSLTYAQSNTEKMVIARLAD